MEAISKDERRQLRVVEGRNWKDPFRSRNLGRDVVRGRQTLFVPGIQCIVRRLDQRPQAEAEAEAEDTSFGGLEVILVMRCYSVPLSRRTTPRIVFPEKGGRKGGGHTMLSWVGTNCRVEAVDRYMVCLLEVRKWRVDNSFGK